MANFEACFEHTMQKEGGYKLTNISGDRGGMTYAGIARNPNPDWEGWRFIDQNGTPPTDTVRKFYKERFWNPLNCDKIDSDLIASSVFDFAVNAGIKTSAKLAQIVVGASPDGVIGQKTIDAINSFGQDRFVSNFALAKIARYRDIVSRDKTQIKFLLGWINRVLDGVS